jgi:hypothetical protein
MMFSMFDKVQLAIALPEASLKEGAIGSVVDVYAQPREAYEVEFTDDLGRTIALIAVDPDQIKLTDQ